MVNFKHYVRDVGKLPLIFFLLMQIFVVYPIVGQSPGAVSQQSDEIVRGRVVDNSDEPMIGVSIAVKGTSVGTITDVNGEFSIKAKSGAILTVSYLGYLTKEIPVREKEHLLVVLTEDTKKLDEVIVVAYGTQKKGNVLAAISSITAEDIERTTSSTTSGALVGKLAGITNRGYSGTPGASTSIQIRNMGTPMFVIDGVIKDEGQFNNIDVNDIESLSIIKDGAAAIYGVKAANGVVLVKTKRGKSGKTDINFNAYTGWQSWTRFPEMSNAYEFTRADYERRINSGQSIDIESSRATLERWRTGYYNPETGEDYRGFDWTSFAQKNVPQTYYSVNASGGTDKINYYIAISRIDQDAVFEDYNFSRNNIQTNLDAQMNKYFKASFSMNGRIETRDNPGLPGDDDYWQARFGMMRNLPTYRPYANDNPQYPAYLPYDANVNLGTMRKDISGFYNEAWRVFQGNWGLEYKAPVPGTLTAKFNYSYYFGFSDRDNFEKAYDTYAYDYKNDKYDVAWRKQDSWMQRNNDKVQENVYQLSLTYDSTFVKKHHITAVVAGETYQRSWGTLRVGQNPTESNILPILTDNRELIAYLTDYYWEGANAGLAARLAYDYEGKYLIEFSGRYDGSYKFPEENRWGFFPSVAAGYRVSEENYFKNSKIGEIISNLKLRASYGQMGDDYLGSLYPDFAYIGGYNFNTSTTIMSADPYTTIDGKVVKGSSSRPYPTTEMTWIKTKMLDIGVDIGFFENRLTMEADYFHRVRDGVPARRSDLILPNETGISVPPENLNSDGILGCDGFMKWADKSNGWDYYFGVNATLARWKNGTTYGERFNNSWDQYRWSTKDRWGNVYGSSNVWATKIIGRFQTQEEIDSYPVIMDDQGNRTVLPGDFIYEDTNGDGRIDGYDERPLGYGEGLPYLTYGINLGFKWKGIDFAVDFAGASMQTIVFDWEGKWPFQNGGNSPTYMLNDRWHHEDIFDPTSPWVPGEYPAIRMDNWREGGSYRRWNSYFMSNTNYLRLKNLEIGYTLPIRWTSAVSLKKVRFYGTGTNLFSFDNMKKKGLDPEQGARSGLDYPLHRVLTVGINVSF